jgi:BMFP domain-containing protein YqiC
MAKFQKKEVIEHASTDPVKTPAAKGFTEVKGFTDAKRYEAPLGLVRALKTRLSELETELETSAKEVRGIEEERAQEASTYAFKMKLEREKQLAEREKEDKEREEGFTKRENALTIAEGDLAELLGVAVDAQGDHLATGKALRLALEAKLKEQFESGEKKGRAAAAAGYDIAKQVDTANTRTELELLKQKVSNLESVNAKLEAANKQLAEANQRLTEQNAEVAKTGLNAAAGVTRQANDALSSAAGTFPGGSRTGR